MLIYSNIFLIYTYYILFICLKPLMTYRTITFRLRHLRYKVFHLTLQSHANAFRSGLVRQGGMNCDKSFMLLSVQHLRVTLAVGEGVLVAWGPTHCCLEKGQRVILGWRIERSQSKTLVALASSDWVVWICSWIVGFDRLAQVITGRDGPVNNHITGWFDDLLFLP